MKKRILFMSLCLLFAEALRSETEPLILLLDSHHEAEEQITGAVTNYLAYALIERSTPILVNGAVLHNFLLLQNKAIKTLDRLKYPTIQKLCGSVHKAQQEMLRSTQETLTYLAGIRQFFITQTNIPAPPIDEASLSAAAADILRLVPTKPATDALMNAYGEVAPTVDTYLQLFQKEYRELLKTACTRHTPNQQKVLLNAYHELLFKHTRELRSITHALHNHIHFVVDAHNTLVDHLFEYVYRFVDLNPRAWNIFSHRTADTYLLVPEENTRSSSLRFKSDIVQTRWQNSTDLITQIERQQGARQGLYALYQNNESSSLSTMHDFFDQHNGLYKSPLQIFMMGHGCFQTTTEHYAAYLRNRAARIGQTIIFCTRLKNASEALLCAHAKKPLSDVISAISGYTLFSLSQYESAAELCNQLFVEQLKATDKNPLVPQPADAEQFLSLYYQALGNDPMAHALFWLFVTELSGSYEQTQRSIENSCRSITPSHDLAPDSARLAGLTVPQFQSFIAEAAQKKALSSAYFFTCFGGGANRIHFEQAAQQLNTDPAFPVSVAVGALTEAAVPSLTPNLGMFIVDKQGDVSFNPPLNFKRFFSEQGVECTKALSDTSLAAVTVGQKYTPSDTSTEFFHGIADAPWHYNPLKKALELVNLNKNLIVIDETQLTRAENLKPTIMVQEAAGVILTAAKNPLNLMIYPHNNLLPILCSSLPTREVTHHIESISLPRSTVADFITTSLAHLKQMRQYTLTIDKLNCAGFLDTKEGGLELCGVTISSELARPDANGGIFQPDHKSPVLWTLRIERAPGHSEIGSCYQLKDYIDTDGKRVLTKLKPA
jgi:hypothetical protein